jgi:hypothetical protein
MSPEKFELTYQLRPEDYRAMMRDFWRLTRFRYWRVKALQGVVFLAGLAGLAGWWFSGDPVDLTLSALACGAPWAAPALNRVYYNRVFAKQRLGEGPMRLTADAEALASSGPTGEFRVPWSSVRRITEPGEAILLWTTPYQAVVVPDRAFADTAGRARFLAFVRARTAGQDF